MTVALWALLVGAAAFAAARVLERRRTSLLAFLAHPPHEQETFDEVVWGVPQGRLPESTPWVLWAIGLLFVGGLGAVALGLGVLVSVRTAPLFVLPTMLLGYAGLSGWRALMSQAGRAPVVQRLRLTQAHLRLDEVQIGLDVTPEAIESARTASHARTIAWCDVRRAQMDDAHRLVICARGHADAVFGPLPANVADRILREIDRRRAHERRSEAEVIDLAKARGRLRELQERASKSDPD